MNRLSRRADGRRPAPLACRRRVAAAAVAAVLAVPSIAGAAGLSEIYRLARDNDAQLAAARQAALAAQERAVQTRAGVLPTVSASGNLRQNADRSSAYSGNRHYESSAIAISASQPLLRVANWKAWEQGQLQARLADLQYAQAEQQLRLRIAQGYFEVLQAGNAVETLAAQKEAFGQQLAQAKRAYDVGLSPITDVSEAQSRYDLTLAQEIAARNELELKRSALEKSIRRELPPLDGLAADAVAVPLNPAQLALIRESAPVTSLQVAIGTTAEQIARLEVEKQDAAHLPTLDLVASAANNRNTNIGLFGGTNVQPRSIGVEFAVPLYQGGAIESRVREAAANLGRAQSELDEARRQATLDARQASLGVQSGAALSVALRQAVESGNTQVRSTRRGFEVGVRTRVDVLNAEQQLYTTQRDLSAARYQTLVAMLQLRAAAGVLTEDDLRELDRLLKK